MIPNSHETQSSYEYQRWLGQQMARINDDYVACRITREMVNAQVNGLQKLACNQRVAARMADMRDTILNTKRQPARPRPSIAAKHRKAVRARIRS